MFPVETDSDHRSSTSSEGGGYRYDFPFGNTDRGETIPIPIINVVSDGVERFQPLRKAAKRVGGW